MPRTKKKITKKTAKKTVVASRSTSHWTESYSSFLLGVVTIIVLVLFGVTLIRQQNHVQQTSSLSIGPTPTVAVSPTPGTTYQKDGNTYYVVRPNDSLWSIAVNVYNDGYQWVDIAKANNLSDPSTIFTGNTLLMPHVPRPSSFGQIEKNENIQPTPCAITGNTYTVQKNDTLWDIAVRAYADGYQWTKIANANHLTNPDLIFSGNVLTIPR